MKRKSARKSTNTTVAHHQAVARSGRRVAARKRRAPAVQTSVELETAILRAHKAHPQWGAQKLLAALAHDGNAGELPQPSTVDAILKQAGLVPVRGSKAPVQTRALPSREATEPNDVWSIHLPRPFVLGDGTRCQPLTVTDQFSHAPLVCRALPAAGFEETRTALDAAFRSFGLPRFVLGENAQPYGSKGLARVSRLGAWLLRYGVRLLFVEPQQPRVGERDDDFQVLLTAAAATPPRESLRAQQSAFDRFRKFYGETRGHSALAMRRPADVYVNSTRSMPARIPEHRYPQGFATRRVRRDGSIKWTGGYAYFGEALAHQLTGLVPLDDGRWHIFLGRQPFGVLHERSRTVLPLADEVELALARATEGAQWQHLPEPRATGRGPARRPIRVRSRKKP